MKKASAISILTCLCILLVPGCKKAPKPADKPTDPTPNILDFRKIVSIAKDKVYPAVVYIKCIRQSHELGKKQSREIAGSGVIINPQAEVLTNWHVVDKAIEIRCLLYDGRAIDAELLGKDKDTDLALLKLKLSPDEQVPYAQLGDSTKLKEGDFVMAMGAPLGLNRSVSIGIISCVDRYLAENSQYSLWLQTDASISPGNSGGPLVNTDGQVIAINTLGVIFAGDMGFSVPSETIKFILPQLREYGQVEWSYLGLQLQPLRDFEKNIYFEQTEGVIVAETDPDSPARKAGIQARDRLINVNNRKIIALTSEKLPAVERYLGTLEKEKTVQICIERNGQIMDLQITPTEKGKVEGIELDCPRWDMTVKTINRFDNPQLYFHRKQGVFIFGIERPGNAANARLQKNDIILEINGKSATMLKDVKTIYNGSVENVENESKLVFNVLRNGLLRQIVLDFARDYEKE